MSFADRDLQRHECRLLPFIVGCSFALSLCLPAYADVDTHLQVGLLGQTIRLTPDYSNDTGMLEAALTICSDVEVDYEIPLYFCLSQIQFSRESQPYFPEAWADLLAYELQLEIVKSDWLTSRLGASKSEIKALPIPVFITEFLQDPNRSPLIRSWLKSRGKQILEALKR